mmetsp:Transcript_14117/g.34515  ORF Transcript_14117/g.34515 Transcript_14117/m.34515 type:complete len:293 (-) Transcript_14117:454-1332(-)
MRRRQDLGCPSQQLQPSDLGHGQHVDVPVGEVHIGSEIFDAFQHSDHHKGPFHLKPLSRLATLQSAAIGPCLPLALLAHLAVRPKGTLGVGFRSVVCLVSKHVQRPGTPSKVDEALQPTDQVSCGSVRRSHCLRLLRQLPRNPPPNPTHRVHHPFSLLYLQDVNGAGLVALQNHVRRTNRIDVAHHLPERTLRPRGHSPQEHFPEHLVSIRELHERIQHLTYCSIPRHAHDPPRHVEIELAHDLPCMPRVGREEDLQGHVCALKERLDLVEELHPLLVPRHRVDHKQDLTLP